ncbi:hypothetical protein GCM10022419_110780 [Nonomuraea rosea]|uniref:WD40 repeat domain-containing protein n=1 Tax=Nonomuraea rosea TaxID=638574 RepID=A0ABP6ZFU2_9ACTN
MGAAWPPRARTRRSRWDVPSRRRTEILSGHQSAIRSLAFLAGDSLIAGADDGRIIRWAFDTDAALCGRLGGI